MEPVSPEELIEIISSASTWSDKGEPDSETYMAQCRELKRVEKSFIGVYLFSLDEWDVFELLNPVLVKHVASELGHDKLKIKVNGDEYDPQPPALRYLLLVPGSADIEEQQEALKLLDAPFIDRMITVAAVLVDNDIYIPAGAEYVGVEPQHQDIVAAMNAVYEAVDGLTRDLDLGSITPAPQLPPTLMRYINQMKDKTFDVSSQQAGFVSEIMALDDLPFIEAVVRISPWLWHECANWIATDENIASRMYYLKQQNDELQGQIRTAPYKSGIMGPAPYEPMIIFKHSVPSTGSWGSGRHMNIKREKLSDMR